MLSLLFYILSYLNPQPVNAISKFHTSYQLYYKVEEGGNTHVTIVVNQKNNLSVVFATDYGISISQTKIENIRVSDDGTLVKPDVLKTQNQTTITFPFSNKVVGKDKIHRFSIEYDSQDVANKSGNTWQINIPRLETDENVSDVTAIVTVPNSFDKPAYIDPKPDLVNGNTYYFSSKILSNKPITAIFGKNQFYKANIKYYLSNNTDQDTKTEIAIPPRTSYQDIFIEEITPNPNFIKTDIDGNLLAEYFLKPHENKSINLKIFFRTDFLPNFPNSKESGENTKPNKIWNHDSIAFTSSDLNMITTPKAIYDFVSSKLKYDYQKIYRGQNIRQSGSLILQNPLSSICTDYTDLFITLARKAKIPAREIEGIAISDNPDLKPIIYTDTDVLHAWPEYFDQKNLRWVQIDPTWANTTRGIDYFNKLDFNHLTFVIHGQDPEFPVPAGGYKTPGKKNKDIEIQPIEEIVFPKPNIDISPGIYGLKKNSFIFKNNTGVYFNSEVEILENDSNYGRTEDLLVPPYSQVEVFTTKKPNLNVKPKTVEAIIKFADESRTVKYFAGPALSKNQIFAAISVILGTVTIVAWRLFLRKR